MCWSDFPTPLLLRYTHLNPKKRVQSPNLALALHLRLQKRYEDASIIQLAILHILAWLCCARAHDYIGYFVNSGARPWLSSIPIFLPLMQLRWQDS
jgi:hypothetical protein